MLEYVLEVKTTTILAVGQNLKSLLIRNQWQTNNWIL